MVGVYFRPGFSAVVRAVDSGVILFCFDSGVQAIRLACRNRNADAANSHPEPPGSPAVSGCQVSAAICGLE